MNAPGHTSAEPLTPPASSTGNSPDSPAASDPGVPTDKVARPPWLALLCGFLLLDGGSDLAWWVLRFNTLEAVKWSLPPSSFMRWYAYGGLWGWATGTWMLLNWLTPAIQIIAGWSIWKTPTRARRQVLIIAYCWALMGLLLAVVPYGSASGGYYWSPAVVAYGLLLVALSCFAVWFVRRAGKLERPEAVLIAGFLLLTGLRGLLPTAFWLDRDVVESIPLVIAGLLMLRHNVPRLSVGILVVLGRALGPAPDFWQCILKSGTGYHYWLSSYLSPAVQDMGEVVIALALARFLWRHPKLFRDLTPRCKTCNYNLTMNTSGVCPECGTEVPAGSTDSPAVEASGRAD